jgi:hypothetical protein
MSVEVLVKGKRGRRYVSRHPWFDRKDKTPEETVQRLLDRDGVRAVDFARERRAAHQDDRYSRQHWQEVVRSLRAEERRGGRS